MFFSLLCFVSIKNGLKELTTSKLGHKCHKMTANAFFWDILLWDIFELAWPPPPPISSKYFYEWKEEEKIVTWWPSLYAVICFFKSLPKSKSEHCHRSFTLHKKNHVQFENFGIKDRYFMITRLSKVKPRKARTTYYNSWCKTIELRISENFFPHIWLSTWPDIDFNAIRDCLLHN